MKNCGFKAIVLKKVKQTANIIPRVLEEIVRSTIEEWRKKSIEEKYVREMNKFLEYAEKNGMRWSDLIVIIGESS